MFALCVESSHQRGMGHLFRMLRFALFLIENDEQVIFYINHNAASIAMLRESQFDYHIVDLEDLDSNWEQGLIQDNNITVWVNDRLNTCLQHAQHVKNMNIRLVTLDDQGSGAGAADLNVAALVFERLQELQGTKVLSGAQYLILDRKIDQFQRMRTEIKKVLISMGGSDTYGVTAQVVEMLKDAEIPVTVIVGPGFEHMQHLQQVMPEHFDLRVNVPSLPEAFVEFDLAITACGVTPFEACASGLPCVVIASENFEVPVGKYLEKTGSSIYAGHYKKMKKIIVDSSINVQSMSKQAMLSVDTKGAERVYKEIKLL